MHLLFVYGTLREPEVQKKIIGREIEGTLDSLLGYNISKIEINNNTYPIILKKIDSSVRGLVLPITLKELQLIDEYETEAYQRIQVTLKSGKEAYVYVKPDS